MLKIPNFNKNEKAILEIAIEKYLEVNNLDKKTTKLTNKLIIEIVDDAHNKWEIITDKVQHKLRDSIKKKCGAIFETMYEKSLREEKERRITLKDKAKQMRDEIVKKHEEEMEKEIKYWGVGETDLEKALNPPPATKPISRVEIMKGTMDDDEEEVDDGSDFIGNISAPVMEEEIQEIKEDVKEVADVIEKVVKEEIEEMVEEAKEKAIEEIQEVKEEIEEVVEEAKKELEIDIDEILDNL